MNPFYQAFNTLIETNTPFVQVTLVDASGSVPQQAGAKMLVTQAGLHTGTVGGGKVEHKALEEAQTLLTSPDTKRTHFVQWNLNKDVGMTCGGTVKLYFEVMNKNTWTIVIFGAGHVSQALVSILLDLDCHVTCIDPRTEWLDKLPQHPKLTTIQTDDMPSIVSQLANDAYITLITMGHTTDKPILLELLKSQRPFPYIGVIGSKAKAVQLHNDIDEAGLPDTCKHQFVCPIGLAIGSHHPTEIAISIVAQLLEVRDRVQ